MGDENLVRLLMSQGCPPGIACEYERMTADIAVLQERVRVLRVALITLRATSEAPTYMSDLDAYEAAIKLTEDTLKATEETPNG